MKTIEQDEHERQQAEEALQKRKMFEMFFETYIDRAQILIKHPEPTYNQYLDKDAVYEIQIYIPLKKDEICNLMEGCK